MPQIDELAIATLNPATPADERTDINAELWRTFKNRLGFPDEDEIHSYLPTLTKASYLEPFYAPYVIGKRTTQTHTAILYLNEYGVVDHGDGTSRYLEKPSIGGFRFLKDVVTNTDIIQAIIRMRVRQVLAFCQPVRDESPLGFKLERVDGEKLTAQPDGDGEQRRQPVQLPCHGLEVEGGRCAVDADDDFNEMLLRPHAHGDGVDRLQLLRGAPRGGQLRVVLDPVLDGR